MFYTASFISRLLAKRPFYQYPKHIIMASSKPCDDCRSKCGKGRIPTEQLLKMEEAFDILQNSTSNSLLKKYLTRQVFDLLKEIQTPMGSTLMDCIQSGIKNLDSSIGVYAPDKDAYTVYSELFDPIIEEIHNFKKTAKHPKSYWGNADDLSNVDPEGKYVVSTRVRCGRSVEDFPFNPKLTEKQYVELEQKISKALKSLTGAHQGTYFPLKNMGKEEQTKLINEHFLFKEGDRFLQAANASRFWPTGRGIFYNPAKNFLVWVCEEDHLRIISMEKGGDIKNVYSRLVSGVAQLEKLLRFSKSPRLGFLTFCPTNLGTTIRASVHIKLPKLSADENKLKAVAAKYNLQVRGTSGEHSETSEGIYDLSNKRRLGLTEFLAIKEMVTGINELIKIEKSM